MNPQEDDSSIRIFLTKYYPDATNVQLLDKGHYSKAFQFELSGGVYVLRLSLKNDHFLIDDYIFKRYGDYLPAAEVLEIGRFTDKSQYYSISKKLDGDKLADLSPINDKVANSFMNQLVEISKMDVTNTSGYGKIIKGEGQNVSWVKFLKGAWSEQDEASALKLAQQIKDGKFDKSVLTEAKSAMNELTTNTYEKRHLIHGDFQPNNILIKRQKVSAVLDWGNAKYGDFAYDIVWTSMHPPQIISEGELIDEYSKSNFDMTNIKNRILVVKISIYVSWAMFSNEIGNFKESQKNQRELAALIR